MKLDIFAKNMTLDNPLRVFIEEKIGGLGRMMKDMGEISTRVEIGRSTRHHRTGKVYYAEANIKIGKVLLRAQSNHEDLRAAITEVKDELQIQIKKFKEKRTDARKLT